MQTEQAEKTIEYEKIPEGGLTHQEAEALLEKLGPNSLPEPKPESVVSIFVRQFKSPLIYILLFAGGVLFAMGETVDGYVILGTLLFNAIVGSVQEGRAQNSLLALKKLVEGRATVLRDGKELIIPDKKVVQGDIIFLQEGELVPADARIISSSNLKIDESALSGESVPVNKLASEGQKNLVFKGTKVLTGNGKALVLATGTSTKIGAIAKEISSIDAEIPLKKSMRHLSKIIIVLTVVFDLVIFVSGLLLGQGAREMFATVVSLSVSIIPEGLPIVLTLVLAAGVWEMSRKNALVKRLQAVEALGQAEVIAVDKTGTITKNELVVRKVFVGDEFFDIGGEGYEPAGQVYSKGSPVDPLNHEGLIFLAKNAALCSGARINFLEEEKKWAVSGDPTEASLLVLAQKIGFHKDVLETEAPLVADFPFDYAKRLRGSLRKTGAQEVLIATGAPESILNICKKVWRNGRNYSMAEKEREQLEKVFEEMSHQGLRVVAVAVGNMHSKEEAFGPAGNFSFVGFVGMKDALRREVPDAMRLAKRAGVRVIMITGDHKITARSIAKEAGIYKDGDSVITGSELEKMDEKELSEKISSVSVFARVSPEHKLRIVKAFKDAGKIIAMTGDGVNDAPSLVAADLGVAMGKIGTEVAKEASDIVLLDDNFASIVYAIEEGRNIYKTIKKVILYLFSTNLGEAMAITTAIFLGWPLPILPVQIIWLNFVTDGFLDVSLAMEPKEKMLLSQKFKKANKRLVDGLMALRMVIMAVVMTAGALFVFGKFFEADPAKARTMSLVVLAIFQWFNAWNCKSESRSLFQTNFFENKFLAGSTVIVIFLQMLAVYNPFMQKILQTVPISLQDWALCIAVAVSILVAEEGRKAVWRMWRSS